MIYLDNAATTPIDEEVLDSMLPYLREQYGNPSSKYYLASERARQAVEEAREKVAQLIGADCEEIIFTSGATESTNLIIKGVLDYSRYYGDGRNHVITSNAEHKAISNCWTSFYHKKFDELISGLLMAKSIYTHPITVDSIISSIKKCEKWPLSKKSADSLCEGEEKGKALLKSMELDESIKGFLEKVISSAATVRDITPEIFQWIKKENLDDKIALSMKNR